MNTAGRHKKRIARDLPGYILVTLVMIALGGWSATNSGPTISYYAPPPIPPTPTEPIPAWQDILRNEQGSLPTTPATIGPIGQFRPIALESPIGTPLALNPTQIALSATPTLTVTPTPTHTSTPTPGTVTPHSQTPTPTTRPIAIGTPTETISWRPPPIAGPVSLDPRDHYWLLRPVDSNANNEGLFYYPYGSDGPEDSYSVHTGLDMPNPIGTPVLAAADGEVIWAGWGLRHADEEIAAYGNVVDICHDIGYRGQPIYTLYAHLSATLVETGDRVYAGQPIGLVGSTGHSSGPHVHFEVRVGRNSWYAVRNPILWMMPYTGTGVIAGRVTFRDGTPAYDVTVTVVDALTGRAVDTTTTYVGATVNPDDEWNENFALGDIPVGLYDVMTRLNGHLVVQRVRVVEGATAFAELSEPATPPSPTETDIGE